MNQYAPAIVGIVVLLGSLLAVFWIITRPPKSLASGILTEGGDAKQAPGDSLSSPASEAGDAPNGGPMTDMDKMMIEKVARAIAPTSWAQKDAGGKGVSLDYTIAKSLSDARAAIAAYNPDDRLREALEPFAREADDWPDKMDCEDIPADATDIKIGDLRRARSALTNEYPADAQPYSGEVNRG